MKRAALALLLLAAPAFGAESLTSGLSQDSVEITSNYNGTDIIVFGAIEEPGEGKIGDVVVIVRGPDTLMTVRRKDRIAGIWMNDARARVVVPSYYFVSATKPLAEIASRDTLSRYEVGISHLHADPEASDGDPGPYVAALVRAQARSGLYRESPSGVEWMSRTLFRARVPVPASVPPGSYNVEVYLFHQGDVVSAQSWPLYIDQTGFERRLFDFAGSSPLLYGVSTVLMAVLLGWGSTFFFRRRA
ncbi:MAG TPA: TIGR02186 family protein [Rhizomicrobium sp.]|nr:TIGR02186 family protein [Rhizomicrobium sp.]